MASSWQYCCRLGTQDPRGSTAATRVLGDKRCHGTTKYAKKRRADTTLNQKVLTPPLWSKHPLHRSSSFKRYGVDDSGTLPKEEAKDTIKSMNVKVSDLYIDVGGQRACGRA
jgi:hypothetical protein